MAVSHRPKSQPPRLSQTTGSASRTSVSLAGAAEAVAARSRRALTPRQIYAFLDQSIVGQAEAKRAVAVAAYSHLRRCSLPAGEKRHLQKSNLLLLGPTGSGKTLLGRKLAECLDVPLAIVDATEYTEAGYYGKDIESMVADLLHVANYSIEAAQRGIIFIDEIDKIARRSQSYKTGGGTRDIGGEGVQQALLKLLEGRQALVPLHGSKSAQKSDLVQIDTSDILFIAAGTFSDLFDYRQTRSIGFADSATEPGRGPSPAPPIKSETLIAYGMLAELLGRLPVRVPLQALAEDDLVAVLRDPPDALTRQYAQQLALDGVELSFSDEALRGIARAALAERSGARGLRSLMETICRDLLFDAPERRGERIRIEPSFVAERLAGRAPSDL
jgi:ATP-dependent Clp protease ATP-binding subunit ClpX